MGKLKPLIEKEVKDLLRDPRIYIGLIVPVIMLPLMGFAMSAAMSGAVEAATKGLNVVVIDHDGTNTSMGFVSILVQAGLNASSIEVGSLEEALEEAKALDSRVLIVIPEGFEETLLNFGKVRVDVYSIIENVGFGSVGAQSFVDRALSISSEILSSMIISRLAPDVEPDVVREPLNITRYTVMRDRVMPISPQTILGQLMMSGIMVPIVLFVLAISVAQIAAIATAVENEEKTLETLLTFPVTRYHILMAKLIGSSVVAILGGILFTVGFLAYFEGAFSMPGLEIGFVNIFQFLPPPPAAAYLVLALSLILSILFITSLGVVIGALSSDVRMAGALLGVLIIPIMIPSIMVTYGDLSTLPVGLQLFIYALPTSYPMIMAKDMVLSGISVEVIYGIPYSAALTMAVVYATSKLLAPEKLLTLQYKLRIRKMRRGVREETR